LLTRFSALLRNDVNVCQRKGVLEQVSTLIPGQQVFAFSHSLLGVERGASPEFSVLSSSALLRR
jgi:hypothetical protein